MVERSENLVSHHLRALRIAGLVRSRREGKMVIYALSESGEALPLLARAKGRVAAQLGSVATAGDAAQSWLCAISAAAVLLSILANAALGWWWLDPIAGLGIAALAVREGREAWAGEVCGDCAPIGFGSATSCREDGCCWTSTRPD